MAGDRDTMALLDQSPHPPCSRAEGEGSGESPPRTVPSMSKNESKKQIFLSYCFKDRSFAEQLDEDLRNEGYLSLPKNVWIPKLTLPSAMEFDIAVVVLSEEYLLSKSPMLELVTLLNAQKFDNEKKILPLFFRIEVSALRDAKMQRLLHTWETYAKEDARIDPRKWLGAVRALFSIKGLVFNDLVSEVAFRKEVVRKIYKLCPSDFKFEVTDMEGKERLCQLVAGKLDQKRKDGRVAVVGLCGMGGVGKTTLCKALCNHFQQDFHGRVHYLDFGSGDALATQKEALRRLTKSRSDLMFDEVQVYRELMELLQRQDVFVAIDNLHSKMDPILLVFLRILFLCLNKNSMCIVASRSAETLKKLPYLEIANVMPCPSLTDPEATNVFARKALPGRSLTSLTPYELEVVRSCVNLCVLNQYPLYHPMALEALGYSLQGVHNRDPLEWKRQNAIPKIIANIDDRTRIYAIIGTLYSTLNDPDKLLFRNIAGFALDSEKLLNVNISLKQLAVTVNTNERDIRRRLKTLESLSILKVEGVSTVVHDLFIDFAHYAFEDEGPGGGGGSPLTIKPTMRSESDEPQSENDELISKTDYPRAPIGESTPLPPATRSEIIHKSIRPTALEAINHIWLDLWPFLISLVFLYCIPSLLILLSMLCSKLWTIYIPIKDILIQASMVILMLMQSFGSYIGAYIPFIGFLLLVVTWAIWINALNSHEAKVVWKYNSWRLLGMIFKSNNFKLLKFADFVRKIFPHLAPCNALQDDVSCSATTSKFVARTHGGGMEGLAASIPIVALSKESFTNRGFQIGAGSVHVTKLRNTENQFHFKSEVRGEVLEDIVAIANWEKIAIVLSILQFWETSPKVGVIENLIYQRGGIYCHALSIKEILQGIHKSLDYFSIFELQGPKQFFVGCGGGLLLVSHDKANGSSDPHKTSSTIVALMGAVGVYYQLRDNYSDVAVISLVVLSVLAILIFVLDFFWPLVQEELFLWDMHCIVPWISKWKVGSLSLAEKDKFFFGLLR